MSGLSDNPWPAISIAISLATFVYSAVATGQRAHRQRVAALERQVTQLNERSKHTPTSELTGLVRELSAKVASMQSELGRLHDRFTRYEDAVIRGAE